MDVKKVGQVCKEFRIAILELSLTDFAKMNDVNLQNIHAFENGRANNIRYIYMYLKVAKGIALDILIEELFINIE